MAAPLSLVENPSPETVTLFLRERFGREPTDAEVADILLQITSGTLPGAWQQWIDNLYDSQFPTGFDDATAPPADTTTPPPAPGPIPPADLPEELLAGLPAFGRATRGLGINTGPGGGALGRFIGNQFGPASTAFTARQFLTGGDPGLGGNPFQSFVEQNLLGGGIRQQAARTFQGLLDLARGGGSMSIPADALQNQFIAPADFGQGRDAAQLARSALGNQIGGFALSRFAPSASDIFSAFAQSEQAGNASSFLPFAQQFLGIRPVSNPFSSFA